MADKKRSRVEQRVISFNKSIKSQTAIAYYDMMIEIMRESARLSLDLQGSRRDFLSLKCYLPEELVCFNDHNRNGNQISSSG